MREANKPGLQDVKGTFDRELNTHSPLASGSAAKETTTLNRQNSASTDLPDMLQHVPHPKSLAINHDPVWSEQGRNFGKPQNIPHELQHSSLRSCQPQWISSVSPFNGTLEAD